MSSLPLKIPLFKANQTRPPALRSGAESDQSKARAEVDARLDNVL
jgi:hypothetical protein